MAWLEELSSGLRALWVNTTESRIDGFMHPVHKRGFMHCPVVHVETILRFFSRRSYIWRRPALHTLLWTGGHTPKAEQLGECHGKSNLSVSCSSNTWNATLTNSIDPFPVFASRFGEVTSFPAREILSCSFLKEHKVLSSHMHNCPPREEGELRYSMQPSHSTDPSHGASIRRRNSTSI